MPLRLKIEAKKISQNDQLKEIIDILDEVRKNHNNIAEGQFESVAQESSSGLYGKFLYLMIEILTGWQLQKKFIVLRSMEIDLDAPAFYLYRFYQNYLNELLRAQINNPSKKAQDKAKAIENRFVLVREILLRTVALALSIKPDDAEYGEKMLKFLWDFIEELTIKEVLLKKNWFKKELSITGIALVTSHVDWFELLSAMIDTVKLIHRPLTSISKVLTYLDHLKASIARHIIVLGYPDLVKDDSLSPDWIMTTFLQFEEKFSKQKECALEVEIETLSENLSSLAWIEAGKNLTERQKSVIKNLNTNYKKEIRNLYRIFNSTNLICLAITQVEMLVHIGGWMFILSGALNLKNLAKLVEIHCNEVVKLLDSVLSAKDFLDNRDERAYKQLIRYRSIQRERIQYSDAADNLKLLELPHVRQQLFTIVMGSLEKLENYQDDIQSIYSTTKLLNNDKIQLLKLSEHSQSIMQSSTSVFRSANSSQEITTEQRSQYLVTVGNSPITLKILQFDANVDIFALFGLRRALAMTAIKECVLSNSVDADFRDKILSCLKNQMTNISLRNDNTWLPENIKNDQEYNKLRGACFDERKKQEQQDINIAHDYDGAKEKLKNYFTTAHIINFINQWYLGDSRFSDYSRYKFYELENKSETTILNLLNLFGFHFYIWEFDADKQNLLLSEATADQPKITDKIIHLLYSREERSLYKLVSPNDKVLKVNFDDEKRRLLQRPLVLKTTKQENQKPFSNDVKLLEQYIEKNKVKELKNFIEQRISMVNTVINEWGYTSLFYAVRLGHVKQVTLLLKNGANPNHQIDGKGCYGGWSPLCMAIANFGKHPFDVQFSMIQALLENGAQIDHQIEHTRQGARTCEGGHWGGWTPLTLAVHNWGKRSHNPDKIVHLLLSYGANPYHIIDDTNWMGYSPFSLNTRNKHSTKDQQEAIKKVLEPFLKSTEKNIKFNIKFKRLPKVCDCEEIIYQKLAHSAENSHFGASSHQSSNEIRLNDSTNLSSFNKGKQPSTEQDNKIVTQLEKANEAYGFFKAGYKDLETRKAEETIRNQQLAKDRYKQLLARPELLDGDDKTKAEKRWKKLNSPEQYFLITK